MNLKTIFFAFLLTSKLTFSATVISKYHFQIPDRVENQTHDIQLELTSEGVLSLEHRIFDYGRYDFPTSPTAPGAKPIPSLAQHSFNLGHNLFNKLNSDLKKLSRQRVLTITAEVVCMAMPLSWQINDHLWVSKLEYNPSHHYNRGVHPRVMPNWSGELKLVHGPRHCSLYSMTRPETKEGQIMAQSMKEKLKTIVLTFLNEEL